MEKITEINRALEDVLKEIAQKESEINTLKQNDIVIKYLDSLSKLRELESNKEELQVQQMENCNHYFVIHTIEDVGDWDRCDYRNIATCIHCGLTNRFDEEAMRWRGFPYNKMIPIIRSGAMTNSDLYHGYYDYDNLNEIKELYDDFRNNNRDMNDKQIEEQIAKVKKPKPRYKCII